MNSWNQNQNLVQSQNTMAGQTQFNPYTWTQRSPVYRADPIHGSNAAWQFPMGPNSEIYLPDADQDIIWWIKTDQTGNRNVIAFDVTPHQDPEPINVEEILARINILEEKVNAKQNQSNAKQSIATTMESGLG